MNATSTALIAFVSFLLLVSAAAAETLSAEEMLAIQESLSLEELNAVQESLLLEEIVITARKTEESLQDVPLSISAFTIEDIARKSLEELDDIALQTPGLTFEDYSNGGFGTPIIRGASQFDINALEQNVSTFIDGIYIPRQYAIDLGTADIKRIEVVKGPQSALYGANSFIGAINYVTEKPNLEELQSNIKVTYGGDGRQDFSGTANIPVIKDILGIKLSAGITEFDGDWNNEHPLANSAPKKGTDDKLGGWDNDFFSVALLAEPTDTLSAELAYSSYNTLTESRAQSRLTASRSDLNCGNPLFGNPANPTVFCGELPDTPVEPDSTGAFIERDFIIDPRSYSESDTDIFRAAINYTASDFASFNYQFGNIKADIFAPGNADRDAISGTIPFGATDPVNFFTVLPAGGFDYDSHELRVELNFDNGIYAMLGSFILRGKDVDSSDAGFEAPLSTTSITQINPSDINAEDNVTRTSTDAWFTRVVVPLLDEQLQLSLEGRYTDESIKTSDETGEFSFDDSYFTPRVTLDYKPYQDLLFYVSFAEGVKSGGVNSAVIPGAPLSNTERFFGPDENTTYEIGSKSTLMGGLLQLNVAAYLIDWSDLQVSAATSDPLATSSTATITTNLGSAKSTGLELDITFLATDDITLNAGLALQNATYDSGVISQRVVRASLCDDIVCAADGNVGGNNLPRSSDTQWNIGAQYDGLLVLNDLDLDFFVRADLVGQSKQYVSEINTATIPARTLLNLRGGISNEKWSAELWVKNATDEEYVANAFYISSPFFVDYVPTFGARRRVGITANYNF